MLRERLSDNQDGDRGVRQDFRRLAAEQKLAYAAPAMRSHHDEIAALEPGESDDCLGGRSIDLMREVRRHAMFGPALFDEGKPFLHDCIYLLVVARGRIVD